MARIIIYLIAALSFAAQPAQAQLPPGLPVAAGESTAPTDEAASDQAEAGPATSAAALIEVLKDPQAREALIVELGRLARDAPQDDAAAQDARGLGPNAARDAAEPAPQPGVAMRLSALARGGLEKIGDSLTAFSAGLNATGRRLEALTDPERLAALTKDLTRLALAIAATIAVLFALRLPIRRLTGRIGDAARDKRGFARLWGWLRVVLVNLAAVMLAWAAGYAIAWGVIESPPGISVNEALFLNAFLVVQLARTGIRAFFMPRSAALRLPPFTDSGAKRWAGRFAAIAALLGYGLLLAAPMVQEHFSFFTRRAVEVVIYAAAAIWALALTIRFREAPLDFLRAHETARGADASLRLLTLAAHLWHWPVIAWLGVVFVNAVANSGSVLPMLASTARVLAVLGATGALAALLGRLAHRGVRLSASLSEVLPMLETRLNRFLRNFLGAGRLLILLLGVVAAVRVSGLVVLSETGLLSEETLTALLSVAMIVSAAFVIWLTIVSWVDYRLGPDRLPPATPREETLLTLFRNAATVAVAIIALMMSFSELGLDIAPLLASAGVLGLAIGFGAQKLVQDIITGVFIQFERAISVGDVVTVAGTTGTVEKLTVRSVSLRDLNGVFHIIPFSSVDMVSNFTRDFSCHVADLGIAYREDVADGKAAMLAAFEELRGIESVRSDILGDIEWFGVNMLGDSAVTLRARIRTRPGRQWAVGRAYNELLKKHCDARGVEIPFPQTTLWFGVDKNGDAPPLRLDGAGKSDRNSPGAEKTSSSSPSAYDTPDNPDGEGDSN